MSPNDYPRLPEDDLIDDRPRRRRSFFEGPGRWVGLGIAIALILGIAFVVGVSQTEWGRGQVLNYTVQALGGRLNGELSVGRLEGNLIGGARLYDVEIYDESGEPLALVDSAFIQYRVATFLGGDIVINRLDVFSGSVDIFRLPGDTLWNYQKILLNPNPSPTAEAGATLIERLLLTDTHIEIRSPVEGDARLSEDRQATALQEILADTARYVIEEVPGGYMQTTAVDVAQGEVAELFIGGEERGGIYLDVVDGVAAIRLWKDPPLEIRGITASLHLNQGILTYDAPRIELPNSTGQSTGTVDLSSGRPLYDLMIESEHFALADLRFMYPWLPADPDMGEGSARLRVEDLPDGLLVAAHEFELRMPDTEITGDVGIITNVVDESLRFVDVDLDADPLRVESVERLLPDGLPVEGLVIGGATIQGTS